MGWLWHEVVPRLFDRLARRRSIAWPSLCQHEATVGSFRELSHLTRVLQWSGTSVPSHCRRHCRLDPDWKLRFRHTPPVAPARAGNFTFCARGKSLI